MIELCLQAMSWLYAALLAPTLVSMPVNGASDFVPNFDKLGPKTGEKVDRWTSLSGVNPEELGEYIEGDIMPSEYDNSSRIRDMMNEPWPNGIVPYGFELSGLTAEEKSKAEKMLHAAFEEIHLNTCVRFKRRTNNDFGYIRFTADKTGCWARLGRAYGGKALNLQFPQCFNNHTIFHELMHVLGFAHEHNRFDRDKYIGVTWNTILPGKAANLDKMDKDMNTYGMGYDYDSVMHFSARAFSPSVSVPILFPSNGMKVGDLGHMEGLSVGDILKIKSRYNCIEC